MEDIVAESKGRRPRGTRRSGGILNRGGFPTVRIFNRKLNEHVRPRKISITNGYETWHGDGINHSQLALVFCLSLSPRVPSCSASPICWYAFQNHAQARDSGLIFALAWLFRFCSSPPRRHSSPGRPPFPKIPRLRGTTVYDNLTRLTIIPLS